MEKQVATIIKVEGSTSSVLSRIFPDEDGIRFAFTVKMADGTKYGYIFHGREPIIDFKNEKLDGQSLEELYIGRPVYVSRHERGIEFLGFVPLPEGYRIIKMADDWYTPEKLDTHKNMWRTFPKGAMGYYSHKTWMGAYRFIQRKVTEKASQAV